MKLINVGFGNLVAAGRLVAVVSPDLLRLAVRMLMGFPWRLNRFVSL